MRIHDFETIARNFDEYCAAMSKELARYQRAYRKGRGRPRGSRARLRHEKIAERFGISPNGHQASDYIAGLLIFGTLNKIEDCQHFTRETVRAFLAANGYSPPVALSTPFDDPEGVWRYPGGEIGWTTTELTPAGEQAVIPGCERNESPRATQLDLFG